MDVPQSGNRVTEARLPSNTAQFSVRNSVQGFLAQELPMVSNVVASTSGGAQRYGDQSCNRPNAQCQYDNANNLSGYFENNGTLYSKGWNEQSDSHREANELVDDFFGLTHYSNPMSPSQNSMDYYHNANCKSDPTNQRRDLWSNCYSDATSKSFLQDSSICNASSSYNDMNGYATGNSALVDYSTNMRSFGMSTPRSNQYSEQLPQPSRDQQQQSQRQSQQTQQTYVQQSYQFSTQQMNQRQSQQLYPSQSNQWNPSVCQPLLQTNRPTDNLNQEAYQIEQQQLNQSQSPRLLLSRKNQKTHQNKMDQAEGSQTQPFDQDLTQQWNQNTPHDMHLNKYQQMHRKQTQQWRQHRTDRMYQSQTQQLQQNQTEPHQQQNCWTLPLQQCQTQQLQQNQSAPEQHWTTPLQQCPTQQIYMSPDQQQETGITPILNDLQFATQTLRFSNSQKLLETNLTETPFFTNRPNACNQSRHGGIYEHYSSTLHSAQKELFKQNQQTWSDLCYNLQTSSIDGGINILNRRELCTGEQKENLPGCQADKISPAKFNFSNNDVLDLESSSNHLLHSTVLELEMNKTSSECNIDTRIAPAGNVLSFLQQPSTTLNYCLNNQDLLSTEHQANQINLEIPAATASCSSGPSLSKISGKKLECEICGNVFKLRSSLHAHRLRHLDPTKRYGCTTCDSKFSDRSSLRKHLRVHTGEQPFECKICGSRFSQAGNFRRHERMAHSATDK